MKNAKDDVEKLCEEVATFQTTAQKLQTLIEGPRGKETKASQQLASAMDDGRLTLEELDKQLQVSTDLKRIGPLGSRAFKRPFESKDVKGTIEDLEHCRGDISWALGFDQTITLQDAEYRVALDTLPVVHGASFDSYAKEHNPPGRVVIKGFKESKVTSVQDNEPHPLHDFSTGQQLARTRATVADLDVAISQLDHDKVDDILKSSFAEVAVGGFSWLLELKMLGLSMDEIAKELLERSREGPWIHSKINTSNVEAYSDDFHIPECLHSRKKNQAISTSSPFSQRPSQSLIVDSARQNIEYFCGIGGVSPVPDGTPDLQFGSVVFENDDSAAVVSLMNPESRQAVLGVVKHLEKAIGTLQQAGGCCDSFTFLVRQKSLVDLQRIDLCHIRAFAEHCSTSTPPTDIFYFQQMLKPIIFPTDSEVITETDGDLDQLLPDALVAQFLSLAFLFYSQGHCEPFRPFFLDTPLRHILLIGSNTWSTSFKGPCILASPVKLSCFGMIQCPVFALQYFDTFERSTVFSDSDMEFDLKVNPEDLLDTWGPGDFITQKDDAENLLAISVGGGLIVSTSAISSAQRPVLHWSRASELELLSASAFPRSQKMIIGSRVLINQACGANLQENNSGGPVNG